MGSALQRMGGCWTRVACRPGYQDCPFIVQALRYFVEYPCWICRLGTEQDDNTALTMHLIINPLLDRFITLTLDLSPII